MSEWKCPECGHVYARNNAGIASHKRKHERQRKYPHLYSEGGGVRPEVKETLERSIKEHADIWRELADS